MHSLDNKLSLQNNPIFFTSLDKILIIIARRDLDRFQVGELRDLLRQELDWNALLKLVQKHHLSQLFVRHLSLHAKDLLSGEIVFKLEREFKARAINNARLVAVLEELLNIFQKNKIFAIPYKGPTLSFLAYNDLSLREFCDLDIFIKPFSAVKAMEILMRQGYEICAPFKNMDSSFAVKNAEGYGAFIHPKTRVNIDIIWKPEGHSLRLSNKASVLYGDFCEVDLYGFKILTFSIESLLLILSLHAAKHCWESLNLICDIAELIKNNTIDWRKIFDFSVSLKIKKILAVNLFLVEKFLQLELPDIVKDFLVKEKKSEIIARKVMEAMFARKNNFLNFHEKIIFFLKRRDNFWQVCWDIFHWIVTPTPRDFNRISLPRKFLFLHYFLRPITLLFSFFAKVFRFLFVMIKYF